MGLTAGNDPNSIAAGPDGNLWFTDTAANAIGRINPTTAAISEFNGGLNAGGSPQYIAAGADGSLWFTDNGTTKAIGRISPTTQAIGEFSGGLNAGSVPLLIAAGLDGNLWFTDGGTTKAIGRITTPPTAVTVSATATGPTSATIAGVADGHAQPTSFHIEYGPVRAATTTTSEQSLGTTSTKTPVSASLSGLTPSTTYQARVVVTNPTGTTAGAFLMFTTAAAAPSPPPAIITKFVLLGAPTASPTGVSFSLTCQAAAGTVCQGLAQLSTLERLLGTRIVALSARRQRRHSKRVVIGSKSFTLAAGAQKKVGVPLNRTGKSLLARFKRIPATLKITLLNTRPPTVIATKTTIKAKKKKKKRKARH
jgi:hypothetical protein